MMPNGARSPTTTRYAATGFAPERVAGSARFEQVLLEGLIPAIEKKVHSVADRERQALADLSTMGGGQFLNYALGDLDASAWLSALSSAPNARPPPVIVPNTAAAKAKLKLLGLSCGGQDGLINISQGVHIYDEERGVPQI